MAKKYVVDEKTGKRVIKKGKGPHKLTPEQRKERGARLNAAKPITVFLRMPHYRLDNVYGPGNVSLKPDLANELLHEEELVAKADEAFYGTKGVLVVGQRRVGNQIVSMTRLVPVETFDTSLGDDNNVAMTFKG